MILQKVRTMLLAIEQSHCNAGSTRAAARASMARALAIGPGTLENLIRPDRVKSVSADIAVKVAALRAKTIEAAIAQLEKERALALQTYAALDGSKVADLEVTLAKLRLEKERE